MRGVTVRGVTVVVGLAGIEPATSSLSGMRSNRLSYSPSEPPSVAKALAGATAEAYSADSSSEMVISTPPNSSAKRL